MSTLAAVSALGSPSFWVSLLTLIGIYSAVTMLLNVEAGWGGMWDLGIVGLLAIGSYTYTITTNPPGEFDVVYAPGWPVWAGILAAMVMTGIVAFFVGLPALRARREYFLIITFAFAEVFRQLAINLRDVTHGTVGFNSVARPFESFFQRDALRAILLIVTWAAALLVFALTRRISRSGYGRALRAMRDNEPVALSLGIRVSRLRLQTFVLVGVAAGGIAPLYMWWLRYANPSVFEPQFTFTAWTALVLGGIASRFGAVLGVAVLLLFTELIELIEVPLDFRNVLVAVHPLAIGLLLVLVLRFRPEGLLSERRTFGERSRRETSLDLALAAMASRLRRLGRRDDTVKAEAL
jgi:branched-chain amino acid transport system permease protein